MKICNAYISPNSHGRHAASDGIVGSKYWTHEIIVFILYAARVDGQIGAVLLKVVVVRF